MSAKRVFSVTGEAALRLLKATYSSADAFPPLKAAAGVVLEIADLVVNFHASKKEWHEFHIYVQDAVATVIDSLAHADPSQTEIRGNLEKLKLVLQGIVKGIETKQRQNSIRRFLSFMEYPEMIADMTRKFDAAIDLFKFGSAMRTEINVEKTLKLAQNNTQSSSIGKLQYVNGASWNTKRVCLSDTRINVIGDVLSWINNPSNTNTLLLTGVAGSGKSTIAHTIAQHCAANKQLVTSFFFDKETNDRNNPKHLISTIAADLCGMDNRIASRISTALESDKSLAGAPISRQFEELVLRPSGGLPIDGPLVILLDALDEGCNSELLQILCDDVCRLPTCFRLFITSRMSPELEDLHQSSHVRSMELDTHGQDNMSDIALFVPHRLKQVAKRHRLGDDWPGQGLTKSFETRAEGLFLWVATICDYLYTRSDPTEELRKLISAPSLSITSAESKMDQLYVTILQACDWSDDAFVRDYQRLMGSAVATKTPLTLSALSSLHDRTPLASHLVLRHLSPLLSGLGEAENSSQSVRFLHQSLRDFLTLRAKNSAESSRFAVDENAHSQTLAYLCLCRMNRDLNRDLPGVGYLAKDETKIPGIPPQSLEDVPEGLWYACQFWVDHVLDAQPSWPATVFEQLQEFLTTKLTIWMELVAACGRYEGISRLIEWLQQAGNQTVLKNNPFNADQSPILTKLARRLNYMDRREEALTAARDSVAVHRQLAQVTPNKSRAGLARSLSSLSHHLTQLGYNREALDAANEAVELQRQLNKDRPETFSSDLSQSLHNLSVQLSALDRHEEALSTIQEAVEIRRRLAKDRPATFNAGFALSLNSLSFKLSNLGRHEEALTIIQEAVEIRRRLAADRPAEFQPGLADSLHNLSRTLCELGRHTDALTTMQEAIDIRRRLATDRPATFLPHLAHSLYNLSIFFSRLGNNQQALAASKESVELYRPLVTRYPARYNKEISNALRCLGRALTATGANEEAQVAFQEAQAITQK